MAELSNAEAALLGLLSEKPMHPYLIEQEVKYRDMRFWTELSMSAIYKLLRKLEKEKLVECTRKVSTENRLQKLYALSRKGKAGLKAKILSLLSSPEHMRWQVDIGIYNSKLLTAKKVCTALKKYRTELQQKITGYKELLNFLKESACPQHRFAIAIRPVFLLEAEIQWVDSYLTELPEQE